MSEKHLKTRSTLLAGLRGRWAPRAVADRADRRTGASFRRGSDSMPRLRWY